MKTPTLFLTLFLTLPAFSQVTDTIFANEKYNTALFFPGKIRQAVVGAENFVFSYNEAQPQHFGLLKASRGTSSNLLVLTEDGAIYSYVLSYRDSLKQYARFIEPAESIGNENPGQETDTPISLDATQPKQDAIEKRETYFKRIASHYLRTSKGKIKSVARADLRLTTKKINYYGNEVFLVMEIENNSEIPFEPDFFMVYTEKGNKRRNSSFQKILKQEVFRWHVPKELQPGEHKRFVLVFSKFTLEKKEKIAVEIREKNGNRLLDLKFSP